MDHYEESLLRRMYSRMSVAQREHLSYLAAEWATLKSELAQLDFERRIPLEILEPALGAPRSSIDSRVFDALGHEDPDNRRRDKQEAK